MGFVELVGFDVALAATVAGWPTSADEAFRWCGRRDVSSDLVAEWSKGDDVRAFGLVDGGVLVGYGELWLDNDEVELARLIVAPDRRRQGIGRRLVEGLVDAARQYETSLICLRVHPDNVSAIRVYLAAGFASVDDATTAEWNVGQPVTYLWLAIDR